jgi:hypothetical protein
MTHKEKIGCYINEKGEIEYFPLVTINGKVYNLIALKALLLAIQTFRFSERIYENQYNNRIYRRKTLRLKKTFRRSR